ncbi:DUF3857 domain-containing protein [Alteraurantiacibacter buctensis]|uniref:DUF3857 domain-containing protein n=1 Tax=Alteraurantiacibacter buctensis TaxID=1503981 RepID=A0A844Z1D6_9SPHN|nr:DUF3857 domain-containing protein [Alteraurantiacibacter buctensis]MXO73158.1 DUF3857 domain-containing protein [Alteraurantiacibacter buctensis]
MFLQAIRLTLAAGAALVLAQPAMAGQELLFGPPPEWVVGFQPARDGETVPAAAELPMIARVSDFQTRLEADRVSHYIAMDLEIRSAQGLAGGNLSLSWQPELDDLTVHRVQILRGDTVIDVLGEGQTFTVLRREQSLEAATLNGILTANMFPAGLEVGDVLRVAYTLQQANPVLRGKPEIMLGPLNGVVEQTHVRLSWPSDLPVTITTGPGLPAPVRGNRNGASFAAITMGMREPLVPPDNAPVRYAMVRTLEASTFADWSQVADLFVPLYRAAAVIPPDGPLRAELERIRAASADPARQAELALDLVQDRVRYVALAMGEGGLVPADAATTWARRYGDCKAKTALLIALLGELGIAAEPVLVSTTLGDALPQRLPGVSGFDHVLVRAHVNGQDFYLDGTRTGDRGLADIATPGFAWGLPVVEGTAGLVTMVAPPLTRPSAETILLVDASAGLRVPAPTQAETVFRDQAAVQVNAALSALVGQARRQQLEEYWRGEFDFLTPETVDMRYDAATGELRLTATGMSELDWDYGTFEPYQMRVGMEPDFRRPAGAGSDAPFVLSHPMFSRTRQEITLPPGFTAEAIIGDPVNEVAAGFEYVRNVSLENNVFVAERSLRSLQPELAVAVATADSPRLQRMWDNRVMLRIPPGYRPSAAEVTALGRADSEDPDELINQGIGLMDAGQWQVALAPLTKASEIAPRNSWAWGNLSVVQARLGNLDGAEASAARALELNPRNHVAWHGRGLRAAQLGDHAAARDAFGEAIDLESNNAFALEQRAGALAELGDFEAALADARTLRQIDPENLRSYMVEGAVLAQAGRNQDVTTLVQTMLAAFPDSSLAQVAASELYEMADMRGEADALLDQSLGGDPTIAALMTSASRRSIGETREKLQDLNRALELQPDFVPALLMRGETLWAEYEYTRALADADRAIVVEPRYWGGYALRVRVLMEQNRRRDAIATLDTMVAAVAGNAEGLVFAGSIARSLNLNARANELFGQARQIDPRIEDRLGQMMN